MIDYHKVTKNISINLLIFNHLTSFIATFFIHFKTASKHPDNYHIYHALKFGDYNVGREGALLTLPTYMEFLLDLMPEEFVLAPVDSSSVNSMVDELMKSP